jgi:hypothetical protein
VDSIVLISTGILFIVIAQLVRRRGLPLALGGERVLAMWWIGYTAVGVFAVVLGVASTM